MRHVGQLPPGLEVRSHVQVPDASVLAPLQGLPNAKYPSDHVPLVFGFRFKKSEAFTSSLPFDQPAGGATSTAGDDDGGAGERRSILCLLLIP